jgi:hypothetical protein
MIGHLAVHPIISRLLHHTQLNSVLAAAHEASLDSIAILLRDII